MDVLGHGNVGTFEGIQGNRYVTAGVNPGQPVQGGGQIDQATAKALQFWLDAPLSARGY